MKKKEKIHNGHLFGNWHKLYISFDLKSVDCPDFVNLVSTLDSLYKDFEKYIIVVIFVPEFFKVERHLTKYSSFNLIICEISYPIKNWTHDVKHFICSTHYAKQFYLIAPLNKYYCHELYKEVLEWCADENSAWFFMFWNPVLQNPRLQKHNEIFGGRISIPIFSYNKINFKNDIFPYFYKFGYDQLYLKCYKIGYIFIGSMCLVASTTLLLI